MSIGFDTVINFTSVRIKLNGQIKGNHLYNLDFILKSIGDRGSRVVKLYIWCIIYCKPSLWDYFYLWWLQKIPSPKPIRKAATLMEAGRQNNLTTSKAGGDDNFVNNKLDKLKSNVTSYWKRMEEFNILLDQTSKWIKLECWLWYHLDIWKTIFSLYVLEKEKKNISTRVNF